VVDAAEFATSALKVRVTYPHEHPRLLTTAIRTAQDRVLIATPALSGTVLDRDLLGVLEAALRRRVRIDVAHCGHSDDPSHTWLAKLTEDHPGFRVRVVSALPVSTMVRDDNLAVCTAFPLLGHFGRERPIRDERGWLVTRPEHVVPLADDLLATLERKAT
jgi:phosphatidylserine/phosphatidylglycerophosphate/cardiolipin synthase-like enzyme